MINPFTGEKVPLYARQLRTYGLRDRRYYERTRARLARLRLAKKYGIPVKLVIDNPGSPIDVNTMEDAYSEPGICVNSAGFSGLGNEEAKDKISDFARVRRLRQEAGQLPPARLGHLKAALLGCPIPIIYCESCGAVPVPESELPVVLPTEVDFHGDSRSPLGRMDSFLHATCPKCGAAARRETDTMDTFVDSSWYYTRAIHRRAVLTLRSTKTRPPTGCPLTSTLAA